MSKIVIFGCKQIAEIAYFYLANYRECEVIAFTIDSLYKDKDEFMGLPLVEFETIERHYPSDEYKLFLPISYTNLNQIREKKYQEAKQKGYELISYISPKATYYNTPIGDNCFVFENNTIQPFTKIGNNVILWSGNHIGHHSTIEDNCFIASHAVISGSVKIGKNSFIGVNATIRDGVTIGKECVIGAGALVLKDVPDFSVISSRSTEISRVPSYKIKKI